MRLSADIVAAYVSRNPTQPQAVPELIRTVRQSLGALAGQTPEAQPAAAPAPAVPITRSVQDDHIVCLEDGKKLKMLKRYLRAALRPEPRGVPAQMGPAARLSDGGARLRRAALGLRQADRPGPRRAPAASEA